MKVLWITNMVFPDAAEALGMSKPASGGWLTYFLDLLAQQEGIQCEVVSGYNQKEYQFVKANDVNYHMVPAGSVISARTKRTQRDCIQKIIDSFQPDVIHIHGTEFSLGLCVLNMETSAKIVVNMQTVAQGLYDHCNGGLRFSALYKNAAVRELMKGKGPLMRKLYSYRRWQKEKVYLKRSRYIIGSTNYDKAYIRALSKAKYFSCRYLFRKEFYEHNGWNAADMEKFSIVTGQAVAPLKGLHKLVECLYHVKQEVPQVRLYVPGPNLSDKAMIRNYTYVKFINRLIDRLDLRDNIVFTGVLDEKQMADRMAKANVVVVPSAIELGSSMVLESMLLGTPVVASFRGGMTENFIHGESGYYYDYGEIYLMKEYILTLFRDVELAKRFSENSRNRAKTVHDPQVCVQRFIDTYKAIIEDGRLLNG